VRNPLPQRPPVFKPLTFSHDPIDHRKNLLIFALGRRQRRAKYIGLYRVVTAYLKACNMLEGRMRDSRELLCSIFGVFCGSWLHSNLYRFNMTFEDFEARIPTFIDLPKPSKPPELFVPDPPPPPGVLASYKRDEQYAARQGLAAALIKRAGNVNPRLYALRWAAQNNLVMRYERRENRLSTLFGPRALSMLDTTEPTQRQALADALLALGYSATAATNIEPQSNEHSHHEQHAQA
jgi:hypothetical protein